MDKIYTPVIGLEIHIEPNTKTKMFCGCPQEHFGKKPNSQTCPICLGLPGALPYANEEAIKKTIKLGLGLNSKVNTFSNFYRKHYFYPDLPKSFQTSQKDNPLCLGGTLMGKSLNHIHLEEDAGKLVHETIDGKKYSLVDFNRSGCALIEIVTEPVFHSTDEVLDFVKELQLIARYLDVSGADMEKGTMRLEANISLSPDGSLPNYKVELKNINSFKFLVNAIKAEIERQETALRKGEKLIQETRGYDEIKKTTFSQRSKEDSQDYRYFPEADLPPIISDGDYVSELKGSIPELPDQKRLRFKNQYNLPGNFIDILVYDKELSDYFEEAARLDKNYKTLADLIVNKKFNLKFPEPGGLVKYLREITNVSYSSQSEVKKAIEMVLSENEKAVNDFKKGNQNVIGFLLGNVQKILKGKGDPKIISGLLQERLNS